MWDVSGKFERESIEKDTAIRELKLDLKQSQHQADDLQLRVEDLEEKLDKMGGETNEVVDQQKLVEKLKTQVCMTMSFN